MHSLPGRYDISGPSSERKLLAADALARLADKLEISLVELSIGFTLNHPAVSSVIIGPRTEEHLRVYLKAADTFLGEYWMRSTNWCRPGRTSWSATPGQ